METEGMMAVVREGMAEVALRNGEESLRFYHGPKHTAMVMYYVRLLAKAADLSPRALFLLSVAAAWHDVEQTMGSGKNEVESARLAGEAMKKYGFPEEDMQMVQKMIAGTEVFFVDEVLHQKAEEMTDLEKLLADADLSYMGAEYSHFLDMSRRFYAERLGQRMDTLIKPQIVASLQSQIKFMTGRRFLTPEAEALFEYSMKNNLEAIQELVDVSS